MALTWKADSSTCDAPVCFSDCKIKQLLVGRHCTGGTSACLIFLKPCKNPIIRYYSHFADENPGYCEYVRSKV